MKRRSFLKEKVHCLSIFLMFGVLSCSPNINVSSHSSAQVSLTSYPSFGWYGELNDLGKSYEDVVERRLKISIIKVLKNKGYELNDSTAEMLVNFHTFYKGDTVRENFVEQGLYHQWQEYDSTFFKSSDNTTIIDFVDAKNKQLLWQGLFKCDFLTNLHKYDYDKKMEAGIEKLLKDYPVKE